MLAHLQLMAKYGPMKMGDLVASDIAAIAGGLGIDVDEQRSHAITQMLASDSVETVAAWAGNPTNLAKLKDFIADPVESENVAVKCPHCAGLFELHYEK